MYVLQKDEDMLKCDAIAQLLSRSGSFWKKVKKCASSKSTRFANTVSGVDGDIAIASGKISERIIRITS